MCYCYYYLINFLIFPQLYITVRICPEFDFKLIKNDPNAGYHKLSHGKFIDNKYDFMSCKSRTDIRAICGWLSKHWYLLGLSANVKKLAIEISIASKDSNLTTGLIILNCKNLLTEIGLPTSRIEELEKTTTTTTIPTTKVTMITQEQIENLVRQHERLGNQRRYLQQSIHQRGRNRGSIRSSGRGENTIKTRGGGSGIITRNNRGGGENVRSRGGGTKNRRGSRIGKDKDDEAPLVETAVELKNTGNKNE